MSKTGPLLVVDDDPDDQDMIDRILSQLKLENERKKFYDGEQLLEYLRATPDKPMVIICDINMPIMNGIQLKEEIEKDPFLKKKSIPFVYLSTSANPQQVRKAYELTVQGFFLKGQSYDELRTALHNIVHYWRHCIHINNI